MRLCNIDKGRKLLACTFIVIFLALSLVFILDRPFSKGDTQNTVIASPNTEITNITIHSSGTLKPEIEVIEFDYKGVHYTCIWIHTKFRGGLSCFQNTTNG